MKIILASASPRRQELFKIIADDFSVISPEVEEITPEGLAPEKCPEYLAVKKAQEIAKTHPESLVVGCDTSVILDGYILGKPTDANDACRMLQCLSGRIHRVVTGCCLCYQGRSDTFYVTTEVEFYPLSMNEIREYINTGEPFDKAGAYGIQGKGSVLVKGIHGDYFNVMGLPIARLKREIQEIQEQET